MGVGSGMGAMAQSKDDCRCRSQWKYLVSKQTRMKEATGRRTQDGGHQAEWTTKPNYLNE